MLHGSEKVSFNTKYKAGTRLRCIKNFHYNGLGDFYSGRYYTICGITYGKCGKVSGSTMVTVYVPYYIFKDAHGKELVFSSDEEFIVHVESHGGSGMSGGGRIEETFDDLIGDRKKKLKKLFGYEN